MRRPIIFALAGLTALGSAGIALAHGNDNADGLKTTPVAATFTAAAGDHLSSRTCTGADGTYTISRGSWNGTAVSSSGRLAGALVIRGELGVNQTTGAGWLVARVRIDGNGDNRKDAGGELNGVIAGGKLTGFLAGRVRDEGALYASVSASVGTGGLTDGQIGGGASSSAAVVVDRGRCEATPKPRPVVDARGTISDVSSTSITVTRSNGQALTCVVGTDLAATVAKLKVGDSAFVYCGLVDGSYRLLKVQAPGLEQKPVVNEKGTVTAISATSLTVKGDDASTTTCVVGADFAAAAAKLAVGNHVAITCAFVDGSYRIVRLATTNTSDKPVIRVEGTVSSVSATSLTVSRKNGESATCAVGADLAATVARVSTGQKVTVACGLVDGSYRLLSLRLDH